MRTKVMVVTLAGCALRRQGKSTLRGVSAG